MKDEKILKKIDYILSGTPEKGSKEIRDSYKKGKRLVLTINSPVDLNIYDANQNHSGPTIVNPNVMENTIEGASYWTMIIINLLLFRKGNTRFY